MEKNIAVYFWVAMTTIYMLVYLFKIGLFKTTEIGLFFMWLWLMGTIFGIFPRYEK